MSRRHLRTSVVALLVSFTTLHLGCGGITTKTDARTDARDASDSRTGGSGGAGGAGGSGGATDAGQDAARDTMMTDAARDVVTDAADAPRDAAVDHADSGVDAGAAIDAPADLAADAAPDSAAETAPETAPDTAGDSAPEAADDSAGDSGPDTGPLPFASITPCAAESNYLTTPTTVTFRVDSNGYSPACLEIARGGSVTFTAAGSSTFAAHPLTARAVSGASANSPITTTSTGTTVTFIFPDAGFFPYVCSNHADMIGVIQVTD